METSGIALIICNFRPVSLHSYEVKCSPSLSHMRPRSWWTRCLSRSLPGRRITHVGLTVLGETGRFQAYQSLYLGITLYESASTGTKSSGLLLVICSYLTATRCLTDGNPRQTQSQSRKPCRLPDMGAVNSVVGNLSYGLSIGATGTILRDSQLGQAGSFIPCS